jgi:hypothetical protein
VTEYGEVPPDQVTEAVMVPVYPVFIAEGVRVRAGVERAGLTITVEVAQKPAAGVPVLPSFTLTE